MANEWKVQGFSKGVQNKLPSEEIEKQAQSDEINWQSVNGVMELVAGRRAISAGGQLGGIYGDIWANRADGTQVHFVKTNTEIGYFDSNEIYQTTITGLTPGSYYSFSAYTPISGNYIYATGVDGLFKISVSSPGSYKNMYFYNPGGIGSNASSSNRLGKSAIYENRMFMWDINDKNGVDKTGLYISKIDAQGTNYISSQEVFAASNGVSTSYSHTLTPTSSFAFFFGVKIYPPKNATTYAVTGITNASQDPVISMPSTTGITIGDYVYVQNALFSGSVTPYTFIAQVSVVGPTAIAIIWNTSGYGTYTSGATINAYKAPVVDDVNGSFRSGATGNINYATGAVTVNFTTAPGPGNILVSYQTENSNLQGITDFSFSTPRTAGQGIIFSLDYLGSPIRTVLPLDGEYVVLKSNTAYQLDLTANDTQASLTIYRKDIGVPFFLSAQSTSKGIVLMDTANPSKPELTILQRNPVGGNLEPSNLTPQFAWDKYGMDSCVVTTHGENIIVMAKNTDAINNDRLFLVNSNQKYSVDITGYGGNTAVSNAGILYVGSSVQNTVFECFTGFDDLGDTIMNQTDTRYENYGDDRLKKLRYLQIKGKIDEAQVLQVYASFDRIGEVLIGTIRGTRDYVDKNSGTTLGYNTVGTASVGYASTTVYDYLHQLKLIKPTKFRLRKLRFMAIGVGYVSIEWYKDFDILAFEQRLPARSRVSVYESLDGTQNDLPNPDLST